MSEEDRMPKHYEQHEFEALRARFEDQTELLYRLTLVDLQVFSGYITLQLALGAWVATNQTDLGSPIVRVGLLIIDLALALITSALLFNSYKRRVEVVEIVKNCNKALGYEDSGIYLDDRPLNAHTKFRPWRGWYFLGIVAGFVGVGLVLFGKFLTSACS